MWIVEYKFKININFLSINYLVQLQVIFRYATNISKILTHSYVDFGY